jgi:integrase/recombinase XerD
MKVHASLGVLLHAYFYDRLIGQRGASPHTVASHRDTFRLLLDFARRTINKPPPLLEIENLDAPFIARFLQHLEKERRNTARSRNVRLAAIRSFFNFVALQEPSLGALVQRVLAIPAKRCKVKPIDFLTRPEVEALLAAPDQNTWTGRRDRTLILVAAQTGLRVSELIGLRCQDVSLETGAHVRCTGKGRKTRCTPLRKEAMVALRNWLGERKAQPSDVLFPNARGQALSRDGVEYLLAKHATVAQRTCPSLEHKRVSPHVLRHYADLRTMPTGVASWPFRAEIHDARSA